MKYLKITLGTIIFFIIITINTAAYENKNADVSTLIEAIPPEIAELLPENTAAERDAIKTADSFSLENLYNFLINLFKKLLPNTFKKLCMLIGFTVLLSVINTAKETLYSKAFINIISYSTTIVSAIFVYDLLSDLQSATALYIETISGVINAAIPIMTLLYTLGGNISAAVVNASGTAFMLTVMNELINKGLVPLMGICFGLSLCSSIGNISGIKQLNKKLKGIFAFVSSSSMTILSFFLFFKTNIAAAADGITVRSIKFAGSFIPVIGSALGDSVRTVMSALSLIKASAGFVGICVIFIITVPSVVSTLLNKLCIDISGGLATMLNCKKESELFNEFSSLLGFSAAIQIGIAVLFIIELTVFVNVAPALGGG